MRSLDYRRGSRSLDVFADNIKDFTKKEDIWGKILEVDFNARGIECSVVDNGVDNTGELITSKLSNENADKRIVFANKEIIVDVKTAPEYLDKFFTFKAFLLEKYIEQDARLVVPRLTCYYWFTVEAIKELLKLPHKIYPAFSEKDSVRVDMIQVEEMIFNKIVLKRTWSSTARDMIKENKYILIKEKRI